jgi:glucosamine-6-phosphate deaminase
VEVFLVKDASDGARLVASYFEDLLSRKPTATLGLITGSSPMPTYDELIDRFRVERISFAHANAFLLDEYVGLPDYHEELYRNVILNHFAGKVDLPADKIHSPNGQAVDISGECARYEQLISAAGGIDLQLLGIGKDGHIGFNEPTSSLSSRTRLKTLMDQTRHDNALYFLDRDHQPQETAVPRHVITQGIGTILEARHLVLIANGEGKAQILRRALEGPVTATVPASALQFHQRLTVVADEGAASALEFREYYLTVQRNKPR